MNGLAGLFNNENNFIGRFTNRLGIFITANLLFVIFSLPMVTIGASFSALYYVMLKYERGDKQLNPFRTFWIGFRDNFKYATSFWLILITGIFLCKLEIFWCGQFFGLIRLFQYALKLLLVAFIVFGFYIFPVLSAFKANLVQQFSNALFFAGKSIPTLLLSCTLLISPFVLTYLFIEWMPLFAFLWCLCGFSFLVWLHGKLLLLSLIHISEPTRH